jgi:hypothetical protein
MNSIYSNSIITLFLRVSILRCLVPFGFVTLVPLMVGATELPSKQTKPCADFLQLMQVKPSHLEFVECSAQKKYGVGVLEAKYRVAGRHAASVEAYFVTTANMPKLRFNCCGSESYEKQAGRVVTYGTINFEKKAYEISMDSCESLVNRRARWPEIPYFIVDVTLVVGDI